MGLSEELQIGKAGEHFVCCDLILQGYNAFLADQGLPYDVLIDIGGVIKRIAVKSTLKLKEYGYRLDKRHSEVSYLLYKFNTRRAKGGKERVREADVDYFAFVALDIKQVAYLPISKMIAHNGTKIKQIMEFKTRRIQYKGRVYPNGTVRSPEWGKYFEDFGKFEQ